MRDQTANLVHTVLECGLHARERLERGTPPRLDEEQAGLKKMLLMDLHRDDDTSPADASSANKRLPTKNEATQNRIRYVLTCWLDELFIRYSPWTETWSQRKLEMALYGTSDGNWKFWQHAQQAEAEADTDALEACHLCVLLGFRGQRIDQVDILRGWLADTQELLARHRRPWQPPAGLEPPTYVPPLEGRARLRRMVLAGGMTAMVLVPFVVFILARHF